MLLILLGPSGCGKTTLETKLTERGIVRLRSHTTRPRKNGETDDAYYFVKRDEFKKAQIVESVLYKNFFFGLSAAEVEKAVTQDCVVTLDWNGAQQLKRLYPFALTVFIDVPMYQLEKRLTATLDNERRREILEQMETDSRCATDCDYIVRNFDGQQEEALEELLKIFATGKK
jgi:guanylate kinase